MERPWPGLIPHVLSKSECSLHIKQKFWQSKLGGAHSSNPDPPIYDAFTKQGNKLSAALPTKAWSPFPTPCDSLWPTICGRSDIVRRQAQASRDLAASTCTLWGDHSCQIRKSRLASLRLRDPSGEKSPDIKPFPQFPHLWMYHPQPASLQPTHQPTVAMKMAPGKTCRAGEPSRWTQCKLQNLIRGCCFTLPC